MYFKQQKYSNTHTSQRGFTLIEMMIAMSLFVIVASIAVGTLMVLLDANNRAQQKQEAMTNLGFMLDSMSREIRTGVFYYGSNGTPVSSADDSTQNCSGCSALSFIEAGGSLTESCHSGGGGRISYRHQGDAIERRLCNGSWEAMSAQNIVVDEFKVTVGGADRSDDFSPTVTLFIKAHTAGLDGDDVELTMQSSVTQQAIDI